MHSWQQILALDEYTKSSIFSYYKFPYTANVRHVSWIEGTFRDAFQLNTKNPQHVLEIQRIMTNLVDGLEIKATDTSIPIDIRESIFSSAINIREKFHEIHKMTELFEHIRNCLLLEYDVLNGPQQMESIEPNLFSWDIFIRLYNHHTHVKRGLSGELNCGVPWTLNEIQMAMAEYKNLWAQFENRFETYFTKLESEIFARTTFRMVKFKAEKQLVAQGKLNHRPLFKLEDLGIYYKYYANRIWCLWNLLERVEPYIFGELPSDLKLYITTECERLDVLKQKVQNKLKSVVSESFVVTIQPTYIIVKETVARAEEKDKEITVQLLVGDEIRALGCVRVTCDIINEVEALRVQMNPNPQRPEKCVNLINDSRTLSAENNFTGEFRRARLSGPIERLKGSNSNYVNTSRYDENNWFYFHATVNTVENIRFEFAEFSRPVKLSTNGGQNGKNMGTMLFDIAAGRFGVLSLLDRPLGVPYQDFETAFLVWFRDLTGSPLNPNDLLQIRLKLLGPAYFEEIMQNPLTIITLEYLRDIEIPGTTDEFTLCEWLYSTTKFISKWFTPQTDGFNVMPGVWANRVFQNMFRVQENPNRTLPIDINGAYSVRFSYNTKDAITIDFVANRVIYSHRYTSKELKTRSLMERIADIPVWTVLYPGAIPRLLLLDYYTLPRNTDTDTNVPFPVRYIEGVTEILNRFAGLSMS